MRTTRIECFQYKANIALPCFLILIAFLGLINFYPANFKSKEVIPRKLFERYLKSKLVTAWCHSRSAKSNSQATLTMVSIWVGDGWLLKYWLTSVYYLPRSACLESCVSKWCESKCASLRIIEAAHYPLKVQKWWINAKKWFKKLQSGL